MSDYFDCDDDDYRPPEPRCEDEWGCLLPGECCMPYPHTKGECYTAEEAEAMEREARGEGECLP